MVSSHIQKLKGAGVSDLQSDVVGCLKVLKDSSLGAERMAISTNEGFPVTGSTILFLFLHCYFLALFRTLSLVLHTSLFFSIHKGFGTVKERKRRKHRRTVGTSLDKVTNTLKIKDRK